MTIIAIIRLAVSCVMHNNAASRHFPFVLQSSNILREWDGSLVPFIDYYKPREEAGSSSYARGIRIHC